MTAALLVFALGSPSLLAGLPQNRNRENLDENRRVARQQIERLEEAWSSALLNADATAMGSLLADDYIGVSAAGTLQSKEDLLANLRAGRMHFTVINHTDRKIRFYSATAVVTSLAEVDGTTVEGHLSGFYRYTRVYVRQPGGAWKIVNFEASPIRTPNTQK